MKDEDGTPAHEATMTGGPPYELLRDGYLISTDPARLDLDLIHLTEA